MFCCSSVQELLLKPEKTVRTVKEKINSNYSDFCKIINSIIGEKTRQLDISLNSIFNRNPISCTCWLKIFLVSLWQSSPKGDDDMMLRERCWKPTNPCCNKLVSMVKGCLGQQVVLSRQWWWALTGSTHCPSIGTTGLQVVVVWIKSVTCFGKKYLELSLRHFSPITIFHLKSVLLIIYSIIGLKLNPNTGPSDLNKSLHCISLPHGKMSCDCASPSQTLSQNTKHISALFCLYTKRVRK